MSECFLKKERKQISEWLDGRKGFDLLYKATRDTCSAKVFHQKCDNKGSTVTVCYNTANCVFGGYTSISWHSDNLYEIDDTAFLFRLQLNGVFQPQKFRVIKPKAAIVCSARFGPSFGEGHDLCTFTGTLEKTRNYFKGNCPTVFGKSFDINGESSMTITADNLQFTDIEVYSVTDRCDFDDEPWRKLPDFSLKALKSEVESFNPLDGLKVKHVNIVLIGPVGAGKSSYFNTVNSIFRGHVTSKALSGSSEHSLTTKYRAYNIPSSESRQNLRFRLCDTCGLEEGQEIKLSYFIDILSGRVPDGYKFIPWLFYDLSGYRKKPTLDDKIHCIAFIMDGCSVDVFPHKILRTIKSIQQEANQRGIPQAVLLTKVDKMCPVVEADLSQIFHSATVKKVVDEVSQLMGLPRAHVFPVKNYEKEVELDPTVDIPVLVSLRQMLRFGDDYLQNVLEEEEDFLYFVLIRAFNLLNKRYFVFFMIPVFLILILILLIGVI